MAHSVLDIDEVEGGLQDILKIEKKTHKYGEEDKLPNYNPIYQDAVERLKDIKVHAERGQFPEKLFKERAPNEDPKEFAYRKKIFKAITTPYWERARATVNRVWNRANFSINYPDQSTTLTERFPIKKYFEEKYPGYGSIISYFEQVVTNEKLKDPNGVIAFKPRNLPFDEDNGYTVPETDPLEPIGAIYNSKQVLKYVDNKFAFIELEETTTLQDGKEGRIFEVYDNQNIWKIFQIGKKQENRFSIFKYFEHGLGMLPVDKLKGKPEQKDANIIYDSYLAPAIPNLDLALADSSTLQMSKYNTAFPQRWEYVDPCGKCGGDGYIRDVEEEDGRKTCDACDGRGKVKKHSPLSTIEIQAPSSTPGDEGDEGVKVPPAGTISPDTDILEFLRKEIREQVEKGFAFLNIDVSNSKVDGQSDTALGKRIDREELFEFLRLISDELFSTLKFAYKVIGKMRYGDDFEMPDISPPIDFAIRSLEEITEELNQARKNKLPSIAIKKLLKEYIQTRFNTDAKADKITELILSVDRVFMLTHKEIIMQKNIGTVAGWEVVLHTSVFSFIQELMMEDGDFLDKEFAEQKEDLEQKAQEKHQAITPNAGSTEELIGENG